ncbi:cellulose synthase/poly-beta-1,6-N-acetylglucosamine synthase-like glycosyltransferase/peptidoglycan/xylan/chitin deacetylase (PgdA/CDA1 family) [Kibdelosporangium banguiense]|uniref:Cellulose synthase/poly-beta-1,6-N-acetylglucosamine synthase-like glycosyltransferase/peptidoglycan/xylan/chitin deacetylase (PgdA/CDA1 family) n=1 Tax=Kibdelosporangium banguiense TaxID=1365924 RepID=A0ABS4TAZ5_9PSEU|nr:glycosyltransferase [Kibdelosporangium banguiense]MBP2321588.1 cellulose synthase/poly-beta-1,6-N-acetylglucosamine synthase-like glycosyltransferase/peptidoglycan/xylan/chitin deacetylase (PgdA/CDA1 family) [Kibdelosporangium banguiense]
MHWITLGLTVFLLLGALAMHAYSVTTAPLADTESQPGGRGPVVRTSDLGLEDRPLTGRTMALVIHDGPNPKWTPRILDALREYGAHATFMLVGKRVNEHPELVRRMLAEGHDVGITGLRPGDITQLPGWQRDLELSLAQQALADATGVHTRLFGQQSRIPDSTLTALGEDGYLVVNPTENAQTLPWGDLTALSAIAERGTAIRMHDVGSVTVDEVYGLLSTMTPRGHRFASISEGLVIPPPHDEASVPSLITARVSAWAQNNGGLLVIILDTLIITAALLAVLRALMQLGLANTARRLAKEHERNPPPWFSPPVSVIVPAYNEAANIAATVRSLLANTHTADVEVIVVDDGSTDGTANIVRALNLPAVRVIRQANAGKSAALNVGIAHAAHDVLILVDGDTVFEPDTIGHLVQPLADSTVGAVSGNTKVANRRSLLGRWQHLEYCAGSNLDRQILNALQCIPTVPGAVGAFRRAALADVGGISSDTIAEDTDLTIAITRAGWRVTYTPAARAWTEVPATLRSLYRQRYRWSFGTFQSMWKHRGSWRDRGPSGRMGRYGLLYLFAFQLLLPLLGPAMDAYVLYGMFLANAPEAIAIWAVFLAVQTAGAGYALHLDGESLKPLWGLPLQQFIYRQLTYLVVIQSVITALHGAQLRWQTNRRTGQAARALASTSPHP